MVIVTGFAVDATWSTTPDRSRSTERRIQELSGAPVRHEPARPSGANRKLAEGALAAPCVCGSEVVPLNGF